MPNPVSPSSRAPIATCTIRLRMSSHDAHYAGELVDGARMLALFGDVATELLIRHDGDEGLFRAYDSIEFLAPVFAGDYIEAYGELVEIGRTSRKMRFEARKVAGNVRQSGVAPSAAEVYDPPIVVTRASGTCVVPLDFQRKHALGAGEITKALPPHVTSKPLIITAAIVGAEVTREQNPHVPFTPEEIAEEARRCREAGASVIHLHARHDDGRATQDKDRFGATIDAIRAKTDVVVQVSTGGAVGMSIDERCQPLLLRPPPDMATLNCGTINFGNDVFVNSRKEIRDVATRIFESGSMPECEVYEVGHLDEALVLHKENRLSPPLHVQFVLGIPGAMGARESTLRFMVAELEASGVAHSWGVAAVGRFQKPLTELAVRMGGHARVGLEDNVYLEKGVLSEGSAPMVARLAAYAESVGRKVADPKQAREMLGLR
ncbi:MAG: 3-aminobutyryl-CoA ammonia lyase [Polyangiales bacterium]